MVAPYGCKGISIRVMVGARVFMLLYFILMIEDSIMHLCMFNKVAVDDVS